MILYSKLYSNFCDVTGTNPSFFLDFCWIQNCSEKKLNLFVEECIRSMAAKKICDFLIVGGGPVGSSVAYHLAKAGAKNIVVLERDFAYRTTSAMLSAGGIRQQFSVPENIKMSIYGAQFIKNIKDLEVDGDVPDVQFHEHGYLFLAGAQSRNILIENQRTQVANGADWIELLETNQLKEKFPWLNTDSIDIGTFGNKNEGYFDPWMLVSALKKKSISMGVEYIEGDVKQGKLVPITSGSSSYRIEEIQYSVNNNRSNIHSITANQVINAAGAWSGRFVDALASSLSNTKGIKSLPVVPRKRCIFSVRCRGLHNIFPIPPRATPLVVDPSGVYFRPEGREEGRYIMGVSPPADEDPDIPVHLETTALQCPDDHLFENIIWPVLAERVPAFEELKVLSSWAGFYDYNTVDEVS